LALDEFDGCTSLLASGDLSTKQFYAVKIDTSGNIALTSTGECAVGILYSKPSAAAAIAMVKVLNGTKCKAIAGGTVTAGDFLKSDSAGKLVTAVKGKTDTSDAGAAADPLIGSHVLGVAIDSAVSGDIFQFLALPMGAIPTTAA
jgi:hypothetical protein